MKVCKFGGTSVATAEQIKKVAEYREERSFKKNHRRLCTWETI